MFDRNKKEVKNFEIALGLFVGYFLAGLINMLVFDRTWSEAFSDEKLLLGFAGVALTIFIMLNVKKKQKENTPE